MGGEVSGKRTLSRPTFAGREHDNVHETLPYDSRITTSEQKLWCLSARCRENVTWRAPSSSICCCAGRRRGRNRLRTIGGNFDNQLPENGVGEGLVARRGDHERA